MKNGKVVVAALLLIALSAVRGQAGPIVFTGPLAATLASFQLQTGAGTVVGANFPNIGLVGDKVLDGVGGNDAGNYFGIATLSFLTPSTQLYSGTSGTSIQEWSTLLLGPDIALSDAEHLVVTMPYDVYSMGFEFHEPSLTAPPPPPDTTNSATAFDSLFAVSLYKGAVPVYNFTFNATDDAAYFVGVWTDVPFDKMDIRETVGGIDNEYFNRVYAGTTPVPDPGSSLLLLGIGLAGLRAWRGRRG